MSQASDYDIIIRRYVCNVSPATMVSILSKNIYILVVYERQWVTGWLQAAVHLRNAGETTTWLCFVSFSFSFRLFAHSSLPIFRLVQSASRASRLRVTHHHQ